jgi:Type IV secretion-system coupling protein DNA-binding domain
VAWFISKDERETARLLMEAKRLKNLSRFQSQADVREWIIDLLVEVCNESDLCLSAIVAQPLGNICWRLLEREPFLFDDERDPVTETLFAGALLRARLRRIIKILAQEEHYLGVWRHALKCVLLAIVQALPVEALTDPSPDGTAPNTPILCPTVPLHSLVDDLPVILTTIFGTLCAPDLVEMELFADFNDVADRLLCAASGIPWNERHSSKRRILFPIDRPETPSAELAQMYTERTVFAGFFDIHIPIPIPPEIRFEHTHILGGTGHGKTQLLQYLIADDLRRALDQRLSLVVFDPDGALIRTISGTDSFGASHLRDRAIFIDPSDVQHPVGLNLFDVSNVENGDVRTRETIQNNTIELFEYFFDALLGSELTGKQTSLFRYLGLLLMEIPGANIHTLRALMENGVPFKPYMEKLSGSARIFFETRFFDPSLAQTKKQILGRLWGVLSSQSLDRIFSATKNSINFDQELQSGKIIFIHTSKEYLGEEGSHIFARLMVALISQSILRRAAISPQDRSPVYIYIDEAEGVIDQTLVRLLAQARKYKAAITLAHQHLDQLTSSARAGVMANTSIKLCGGISAKDAAGLAPEYRATAQFLLSQTKNRDVSSFALFAKNITPSAMTFTVPLGYVEGMKRLTPNEYTDLLDGSRACYGRTEHPIEHTTEHQKTRDLRGNPPIDVPKANIVAHATEHLVEHPSAPLRKEGGGGARHQGICATIKELGEAAGFRASIEETILDGEGRVDVILRKAERAIAFEVSVTTSREHELLNVRKCLRAGFQEIVVVAALPRHLVSLDRHFAHMIPSTDKGKVQVIDAAALHSLVEAFTTKDSVRLVRGYKVKTNYQGNERRIQIENSIKGLI